MSAPTVPPTDAVRATRRRVIRAWLWAVSFLVFLMVVVGGATRLTESGLSIVEWKPVTGTLPPLSEAAWQAEFEKYKAIPQYQQVNRGMSLSEFRTIFYWEWGHRLLGRLIGAAFLVPFLVFLWRGWVEPGLRWRLWTIFGLGGLQGAVGWWMVASGLVDRINVSQYRLAAHLTLACVIFVAQAWTAERIVARKPVDTTPGLRAGAAALVVLVLLQIYLGALVAGLRAGYVFNTWPLIDGALVPGADQLFAMQPAWRNLFENVLTVQFVHRMAAYALWLAAVWHVAAVVRAGKAGAASTGALVLAAAVTIQAALGILTLVYEVQIGLALMHQGLAIVVLAIAVVHAERLSPRREEAAGRAPIAATSAG